MKTNSLVKILSAAAFAAMLSVSSSVFAQVKIGTNPTTIGATNNLEVEASTPGRKTSIDKVTGQVTIQDGTQAMNRVLTSDSTGRSSWQSLATQRVPETIFIGQQASTYVITQFNGTFDSLKDRIPLVPRAGSLPGYDAATKQYTLQTAGYYRFNIGAGISGTLPPGTGTTEARLYLVPSFVLESYSPISTGTGPVLSTYWEGFYAAGTKVDAFVISTGPLNQNLFVSGTFLSITKLF